MKVSMLKKLRLRRVYVPIVCGLLVGLMLILLFPFGMSISGEGYVSISLRTVLAATESLAPDALLQQDNLSGTLADIDEDPDSPDTNWLIHIASKTDTVTRVSFPTPTGNPTMGVDLQEFKVWVRQQPDGAGADPTVRIELYEDGVSLATILADTAVPSTTGALYSGTWNANLLGTADGSLVECYIYGTAVGGAPSNRCTVEVGAVEWNVDYSTLPDIVVDPTTYDFGTVSENTTPDTGNGYFAITNNSGMTIDIDIKCDGWLHQTGTNDWVYGSPIGENKGFLKASSANGGIGGSQGQGLYDIEMLDGTDTLLCDDVGVGTDPTFEVQLNTPSAYTHGDKQRSTVTLTASAS